MVELPHCVGSEAVYQKQRRLRAYVSFGNPAMHDGAIAKVGGEGFEARPTEGVAIAGVLQGREARTLGHSLFCFVLYLLSNLSSDLISQSKIMVTKIKFFFFS